MTTQHDTAKEPRRDASSETLAIAVDAPRAGGARRTVAIVSAALLVPLVVLAAYLVQRDHSRAVTVSDKSGTSVVPGSSSSDLQPGLHVTLAGPTSVSVGAKTTYTVTYTDDNGQFLGSVQDWGDTGDGSLKQGKCGPGSSAAGPASGTFAAEHTWAKAGTYTVAITVTTQSCAGGQSSTEDASASTTVTVTGS